MSRWRVTKDYRLGPGVRPAVIDVPAEAELAAAARAIAAERGRVWVIIGDASWRDIGQVRAFERALAEEGFAQAAKRRIGLTWVELWRVPAGPEPVTPTGSPSGT